MERFENATVSDSCGRVNSLKTQTFEIDSSCDLSPSPLAFKTKMENIDRERIVVFIGISLLLSWIVNWQLNVYAHKFI